MGLEPQPEHQQDPDRASQREGELLVEGTDPSGRGLYTAQEVAALIELYGGPNGSRARATTDHMKRVEIVRDGETIGISSMARGLKFLALGSLLLQEMIEKGLEVDQNRSPLIVMCYNLEIEGDTLKFVVSADDVEDLLSAHKSEQSLAERHSPRERNDDPNCLGQAQFSSLTPGQNTFVGVQRIMAFGERLSPLTESAA